MNIKYTKEKLEPLVKESKSIADIIRKLGLKESGGSHSHITNKLKNLKLIFHILQEKYII